jgi:hypothetical protein
MAYAESCADARCHACGIRDPFYEPYFDNATTVVPPAWRECLACVGASTAQLVVDRLEHLLWDSSKQQNFSDM